MPTLNAMVDECLLNLAGYGIVQPRTLMLTTGVDNAITSFVLSDTSGLAAGLAEIEQELVYVVSVDQPSKTATVIRGYRSTTAAAHAAGTGFMANPVWSRAVVANAINDAIVNSYPDLFAVSTSALTASASLTTYDLDPSVDEVREVKFQILGPSQQWHRVRNYWFDNDMKTLTIEEMILPGQPIRVVTQHGPTVIGVNNDLTASGLQTTAKKYVVAQACADLVKMAGANRLLTEAAAPRDMGQSRPATTATEMARVFLSLAQFELEKEQKRLLTKYPIPIRKARSR